MHEGFGAIDSTSPYFQSVHDLAPSVLGRALRSHRFSGTHDLIFEILTDEARLRTQYVDVSLFDGYDPGRPAVVITSRVGTLVGLDQALLALKMSRDHPLANVSVDDANTLHVTTAFLQATSATPSEICQQVLAVARLADALEAAIFGWDRT